jgi:hypothetical protein
MRRQAAQPRVSRRLAAAGLLAAALVACAFAARSRVRGPGGGPDDAAYWVRQAQSPNLRSQWVALARLGESGAPEAYPVLLEKLQASPHAEIRRAAAAALGAFGSSRAVATLLRAARGDRSPVVQLAAVRALGRIGDASALPGLTELCRGKYRWAEQAAEMIGRLDSPEAEDVLLGALGSPDPDIRAGAVRGLGHCGTARARDVLRRLRDTAARSPEGRGPYKPLPGGGDGGPLVTACSDAIEAISARLGTGRRRE